MKLTQLMYFHSVCRHNNITKAAAELHVSQPSVSQAIKELEAEFGLPLFIRQNKGLYLTEEGRFFWERAQNILEAAERLTSDMLELGNRQQGLTVAVPPVIGAYLFPEVSRRFRQSHPELELIVTDCSYNEAFNALENDAADFAAVFAEAGQEIRSYESLDLLSTELYCCASKSHPLAGAGRLSLERLAGVPLIMLKDGSFQTAIFKRKFRALGIEPRIALYSSQLYTIANKLTEGEAGAFLIREMSHFHPEIAAVPLDEPIRLDLRLLWKRSRPLKRSQRLFIEQMKSLDFQREFRL